MDHARTHNSENRRRLHFAGELYRAYLDELADIAAYTHYAILAEDISHTVAALFMELAEAEMQHFAHLGRQLHALGFSPAVDTRLRAVPVEKRREEQDVQQARQNVRERIVEEQQGAERYRRLADRAPTQESAALLREIAADEERHAAALMRVMERQSSS